MTSIATIALFDFVTGTAAGLALLYLLYSETFVVHYPRFFRIVTAGLLIFAVTGPVIGTVAPALIHLVHGIAGLAVAAGCYDLLVSELDPDDDFETLFGLDDVGVPGEAADAENDD